MRTRTGTAAAAAVVTLGALLLSGCGGTPGAAAFVGEDRIADVTVQDWVHSALQDRPEQAPPVDVPSFSREVLTVLVREPLLAQTADRLDVDVDERSISAAVQPLVDAAGGSEEYAENLRLSGIPSDYLDVWVSVEGMQLLLAESLVSDREISEEELRAIWVNDPQLSQIPFEQAEPEIRRFLLAQDSGELLLRELRATAESEGVDVSQRYGAFDEIELAVVPALPATVRPPGSVNLSPGDLVVPQ